MTIEAAAQAHRVRRPALTKRIMRVKIEQTKSLRPEKASRQNAEAEPKDRTLLSFIHERAASNISAACSTFNASVHHSTSIRLSAAATENMPASCSSAVDGLATATATAVHPATGCSAATVCRAAAALRFHATSLGGAYQSSLGQTRGDPSSLQSSALSWICRPPSV